MMKNQWKRVAALMMMVALLFAFSAPALAASQTSGTFTLHLKQKPTPEPEKEPEATEQPAEAPKPTEEQEPQVTEAPAAETTEEPAEEIKWVVDEKGNIVLDASGNPIPANTIPEGAQKLATLVDKISPDRTIDIYAVHEGKYLTYGDQVTLVAVLNGYGSLVYNIQWQVSRDGSWEDLSGAHTTAYSFVLNEDNYNYNWRILVNITDITG